MVSSRQSGRAGRAKQKAVAPVPVELLEQFLAQVEYKDAESIFGESDLAGQLKTMLAERMLSAELNHQVINEEDGGKNHRNGSNPKKVLKPDGELSLDMQHDQLSSFKPKPVVKHQRRTSAFDDHVISMY
jgi:putative transposase